MNSFFIVWISGELFLRGRGFEHFSKNLFQDEIQYLASLKLIRKGNIFNFKTGISPFKFPKRYLNFT